MIVTTCALKAFLDLQNLDLNEVCNRLSSLGLEIESTYKISVPSKVVVGKIIRRKAHPNAERLSICDVDIGSEVLQIVCGARNARIDLYVAVALIGASLPPKGDSKLPFNIVKSTIRDIESSGMLCSSEELGLPVLGEGIMELDSSIGELVLGKELKEYAVFNQDVIELGITPNRGDCLYVLGVAREIASSFNLILKSLPAGDNSLAIGVGRILQLLSHGELDANLMYKIVEIKDMFLPLAIALSLGIAKRYKKEKIENFLEYATYMSGVIFNAYPLDDREISLNGETVKLDIRRDELGLESVYSIVKKGDNEEVTKLSTIGAKRYEVTPNDYPRTFVIEASHIHPDTISNEIFKAKDKLAQDKDVTYLSTRGSNSSLELGMGFLCMLFDSLDDVVVYSGEQKIMHKLEPLNIDMTFSYISKVIGNDISNDEIAIILKRLNFLLKTTCDEDYFILTPPIYRFDIVNRQDVAEEILRCTGIQNIKSKPLLIEQTLNSSLAYDKHKLTKDIRTKALALGFYECLHYVFSSSQKLLELGFKPLSQDKALLNPITKDLDTLRPSLIPNILESMQRNKNLGYKSVSFFEIGTVYDEQRNPSLNIAFGVCGDRLSPSYPNPKGSLWEFYGFARALTKVIDNFELINLSDDLEENVSNGLYHPYQSAFVYKDGIRLGIISKLNPKVCTMYDLENVFWAELDMELVLKAKLKKLEKKAKPYSTFQASRRDLTVLINSRIPFSRIKASLQKESLDSIVGFYPLDVYKEDKHMHALTIRFILQSSEKTLLQEDIEESISKVLKILESNFDARLK
ncbi:phenylalanine--tRNA ligase subunit beta [Helicobacter sp. 13S00401-1]|uniref:phenylalanine--tRNA ligase subunit beta n=1 Tax=Helicobacter sp. 13S00401-1 TaxID=1905758 RepID=UPI000BA78068|nr:phenylalanine--tRNA ligase subunit beta [Helicobacter sp. 13S00401-1]PAF51817.1 phenylalanine--tRNA ligase subunit beta [Helicobacter sp. 13S00401-1]